MIYRLVSTDNNVDGGQVALHTNPSTPHLCPPETPRLAHAEDSDPGSSRSNVNSRQDPYDFHDLDPDEAIGGDEYEYQQIRIIPGSGDELENHIGQPADIDPLDDPEGYYADCDANKPLPDVSNFHGYHAISPIMSAKNDRVPSQPQDIALTMDQEEEEEEDVSIRGGNGHNTVSGDYDNVVIDSDPNNHSVPMYEDNYDAIHQFMTSTPVTNNGNGTPQKSTFKPNGYPKVLSGNGSVRSEEMTPEDVEALYAKPNKRTAARPNGNGHAGRLY